ncbi:hypothetical protein MMC21_001643 [Puttea exsequens]|nr:hypothetical protein [Puttea exsequens]
MTNLHNGQEEGPPRAAWLDRLTTPRSVKENKAHFWGKDPSCLITNSDVAAEQLTTGNGADIYETTILPALESAEEEIILVTCFWARSVSLERLSATLLRISSNARFRRDGSKLRVRLCFSSRSFSQKLFHTSSPAGKTYPPSRWQSLGLPTPEAIQNLDLEVKSLFFLPFSVMHPKFVIIDRKRALLPSCNVSRESWFECCLPVSGPVVATLLDFWREIWGRNDLPSLEVGDSGQDSYPTTLVSAPNSPNGRNGTASTKPTDSSTTSSPVLIAHPSTPLTTALLPSPHHRHPRFRPLIHPSSPPPTPLNTYLIDLFSTARHYIRLLTPNLTSPPVLHALQSALTRGINVSIITNRRLMVLEQLLTAGTTTEVCIWKLRRRWKKMLSSRGPSTFSASIEEGRHPNPGVLHVGYFKPEEKRYQRSHVKCTIVDGEVVVLGSGNMDRASWYTSQEVGVAVEGRDAVREIWGMIERELGGEKMEKVEWLRFKGFGATRSS